MKQKSTVKPGCNRRITIFSSLISCGIKLFLCFHRLWNNQFEFGLHVVLILCLKTMHHCKKKKNQPAKNISIPCHRKKYFTTTIFKNKFSEIHFLSTCFVKIWKLKHFLGHEIISNFISTQNKQIHVTNKQTICPQLRGHWSNFDFHQHQQRSPQRAMMGKYSHV